MELNLTTVLAILSSVFCIVTFVVNRIDKAKQNTKENHQELIEYQLKELKDDVKSILNKLDKYETDVDEKIDKAIELHIKLYHKGEK
jgi:peptidoglycan hydrolase CwlO-like protein